MRNYDSFETLWKRLLTPVLKQDYYTLIASLPDFGLSAGQRRAKGATADAEDKSPVVIADMTYSEWAGQVKKALANSGKSDIMRSMEENAGLTAEQARKATPHQETYGADAISVDLDYIHSNEYRMKFHGITGNPIVDDRIAEQCRDILESRTGTYKETLSILDADKGSLIAKITDSPGDNQIVYDDQILGVIEAVKNRGHKLLSIHNHPEGYPPTADDCVSAYHRGYELGVVCGHNGAIYTYEPSAVPLSNKEAKENRIELYKIGINGIIGE